MASTAAAGFLQLQRAGESLRCGEQALLPVSSPVGEPRLQCAGLSGCGAQAESPAAGGPLQDRDQAQVACVGRWILNDCTTREVPVVGPCLSVLYMEVRVCQPQTPNYPSPTSSSLGTVSLFATPVILFLFSK